MTLGELIDRTPEAAARLQRAVAAASATGVFVVIADETRRPEALRLAAALRAAGHRVEYPLGPAKVGKQFQTAETLAARVAVVVGTEWPLVKLKTLATREETLLPADTLEARLRDTPAD